MQRELRFRTWFQDQMTYLEQSIGKYDYENGIVLSFSDEGYDEFGAHERFDVSQSNPPPMMQCTGLRDKNGKEIYEGDILKYSDGSDVSHHKIFFDEKIGRWSDVRMEDQDCQTTYDGFEFVGDCVVIGNIYENPDLIYEPKKIKRNVKRNIWGAEIDDSIDFTKNAGRRDEM